MIIRPEQPADVSHIYEVTKSAFPKPDEAELVDRLRANGDSVVSLVAVENSLIIGHVLLSKMEAPFKALGLGHVSIIPQAQGKGAGSALIKEGIRLAKENGWEAIFCLGDPKYYQRFGFDVAAAIGFSSPYAGPNFMALFLNGEVPMRKGGVAYASAFAALG